jgi:hypothetical protein
VMARDIIFLASLVQWEITREPILSFFAKFLLFSRRKSERICDGQVGGGGGGSIVFFRVPNSLQGCDGWGEGRGILFIKASLVQ